MPRDRQSSSADPDADLIPGLKARDETLFARLVDRHINTLHQLAVHMVKDPFLAEDIVQTTFLKTWNMLPNWKPGQARLLTWMRRVTTHACLDHLRKIRPVTGVSLPERADERPTAEQSLVTRDRARLVQAAIHALPDRQRAALTLSYYQHVSQNDGAEILGVSVSAYESLLVRARQNLKAWLLNDSQGKSLMGGLS